MAIFQHDCTGSNTLNGGLWICIKMKKNQEKLFYSDYFRIAGVSFRYRRLFSKKYYSYKIFTFWWENQNSESTFISSTLKVEETKVSSEFQFSYLKHEY